MSDGHGATAATTTDAWAGTLRDGAGGAAAAFRYNDGRRMKEIQGILGFRPWPGSLNVHLDRPFSWDTPAAHEGQLLDVVERGNGLDVPWAPCWGRFWPVRLSLGNVTLRAYVFRFDKDRERYPAHQVELVAPARLRDYLGDSDREVTLCLA